MKHCSTCNCRQKYKCDECKKKLNLGVPVVIEFGYDSEHDMEDYKFCGIECAVEYLTALALQDKAREIFKGGEDMKNIIEVINIKDNPDGSANVTFAYDKPFADNIKRYYGAKRASKKNVERFIKEAMDNMVEEYKKKRK